MASPLDNALPDPNPSDKSTTPVSPASPDDGNKNMAGVERSPQFLPFPDETFSGFDDATTADTTSSTRTRDTALTTRTSATSTSTSTTSTSTTPTSTSTSTAPTTTASSTTEASPTTTSTTPTSTTAASTQTTPTSSSIPTSSTAPTSSFSQPVVVVTYTTTDGNGAVVTGLSSSANPSATGSSSSSGSGSGSNANLGAIIGGVAGGVAGLIILIWLILLPLRKRAKKQKEVEWLTFGQENDHVNDNSAEAVYGRGAGGSGEGKGGSVANVNEIQMDDMAHEMSQQPYPYQNVDNGAAWGAAGAGAAAAGAYAHHDAYAQHQQDGYDPYYAQQQQAYGGEQYHQQYAMQSQQGWAGQQGGAYPQGEAWGAAPSYTSPTPSQAHGQGLQHNLSIGSTRVGDASGVAKGSQDGQAAGSQYGGYPSPPLGAQSPQHYPQQYQGHAAAPSPPMQAQYYQGHHDQDQVNQHTGNGGNAGGLHLANP